MREELVDEFDVRTFSGETYHCYVYQQIINAGTYDDPSATIPGMKRIVTEDGNPVNFIDERNYHLVIEGLDARRV